MTEKTYNGWTNYETWNVALWIDNDYGLYRLKNDCRPADGPDQSYAPDDATTPSGGWTARDVEEFVREIFPNGTPDMNTNWELELVDYDELADDWNLE